MRRLLPLTVAGLLASGCATMPLGDPVDYDPWEKPNRTLFRFNEVVDTVTLKPIAKGYRKITPSPVRTGITNFFRNLGSPRSAVNNFLQGKPGDGFGEILRFIVNSTIGVGGLIDIASASGLPARPEDFGQTAAVWGIGPGPYVILPMLGPRTLRDTLLFPFDLVTDPLYHYDVTSVRDRLNVLRTIDLRTRILSLEELLADSPDPYLSLRESYLQNREFQIYDGNPPMNDDDEFYDEFLEEEDY